VAALAHSLKLTRGWQLRLDSSVVETDIHHSSDNTLPNEAREQERRTLYRRLVTVARASHCQAEQVRELLERRSPVATSGLGAALDQW
jgi:hypothetical protein